MFPVDPVHQGVVELKLAQSGYVSREKRGTPHVATANRTVRTPITLTPSPAFTFSNQHTWVKTSFSVSVGSIYLSVSHHVHHADVSVGEDDGVGRVGHRQQEGEGRTQGGGDEDVERVDVDGLGLRAAHTHQHLAHLY